MNAPRILYLASALPYPPDSGSKIRSWHFLKYLAGKGRVTLMAPYDPAAETPFLETLQAQCEEVIPVNQRTFWFSRSRREQPGWWARGAALLRGRSWNIQDFVSDAFRRALLAAEPETFDLIVVRYPLMAYDLFREPALRGALAKTVIDVDDVAIRSQARALASLPPGYEKLRRVVDLALLRRYYRNLRRVRACLAVSELDRRYLVSQGFAGQVFVVPNAVEVNGEAAADGHGGGLPTLLFIGRLSYPPNADAAVFFCERIFPKIRAARPQARALIVGKHPRRRVQALSRLAGVEVVADVPDIEPFYRRAAVAVTPLLSGAGTRVKILEAMALRTPVVSTSVGCEGLDVVDGTHLLIADEPGEFAEHCLELLADASRRAALADNAYRLVKERYDVSAFRRAMDASLAGAGMLR
jgi:glycosyltransferase involved in cell wall biosynthesis